MAVSHSSGSSTKSHGGGIAAETKDFDFPKGAFSEPLYQVKLLAALRTGDISQIHPFLDEIGRDASHKRKLSTDPDQYEVSGANGSEVDMAAAALHLAIRCASRDTIEILLSHRAISPNAPYPPGSGTTPLHLAASLGRADIVSLLLEQDGVNDTVRDREGRTCKDVAKGKTVLNILRDSRQLLTARYCSLLHAYISSPSTFAQASSSQTAQNQLYSLLSSPRAALLDLNYLDPSSGRALLHEACLRRDLGMIEKCVRAGGDVWVRDVKGRGVFDAVYTGSRSAHGQSEKDKGDKSGGERVKVFLRQFCNQDPTLLTPNRSYSTNGPYTFAGNGLFDTSADNDEPPTLRGYLNKYTNVAKGYNTRWFVLKDGIISYYRHQDDENITSRGSISMRTAVLKVPTSFSFSTSSSASTPNSPTQAIPYILPTNHPDKLRFEVHSIPSRTGSTSGQQKWYLKASHAGEVARWIRVLAMNIEVARRKEGTGIGGGTSGLGVGTSSGGGSGSDVDSRQRNSLDSDNDRKSVRSVVRKGLQKMGTRSSTVTVFALGNSAATPSINTSVIPSGKRSPVSSIETGDEKDYSGSHAHVDTGTTIGDFPHRHGNQRGDEDEDSEDDDMSEDILSESLPPHENSFILQGNAINTQVDLNAQLLSEYFSSINGGAVQSSSRSQYSFNSNAQSLSLSQTQSALSEALNATRQMVNEYIQMSSDREDWYRRKLEKEKERGQVWEESLQMVVKEGDLLEKELKRRVRKEKERDSRLSRARSSSILRPTGSVRSKSVITSSVQTQSPSDVISPLLSPPAIITTAPATTSDAPMRLMIPTTDRANDDESEPTVKEEADTDDEDEFFDAIESNNLPNLVVTSVLASPSSATLDKPLPLGLDVEQYQGYTNLRTRLPINEDKRPPTSLWSVLKHSIGKDLTKISFPVFFNEPTSMLQRMAEDMEFSECLDAAVAEADPHKRIAFVAAFAMSNYSSTIGRIAKPFNPMLSETFEYVRLDKQYRYVSEQVSHHPPISACWAEAPNWHYFGEVDAQNKFMGKSFEIRPTGVAHAELAIPEEWGPDYPRATQLIHKGKVMEHFSWKKVTTSVSGFILGSPSIDHYGDMVITNHRTGDQCTLTFKPRGWRGKDAYEIYGKVLDSAGNVTYEIAGRWNSQLVARAIGTGFGNLHPDVKVGSPRPTSPTSGAEFILLWRNTEKPKAPFNLTPFAITLNDCPDTLKPYVCPTDCRLRPDQRAFEVGLYDRANELKNKQEEFQRATRKAREERKIPLHRPRWFEATTDGDTGERVWEPVRAKDGKLEYWNMREQVWKNTGTWTDVDKIFIDEDP